MSRYWPAAFLLLAAGAAGVVASLPLGRAVLDAAEAALRARGEAPAADDAPAWLRAVGPVVSPLVTLVPAVLLGVWLSRRVGLRAPLLDAWLAGAPVPEVRSLGRAVVAGLATGAATLALDALAFARHVPAALHEPLLRVPLWQRLAGGVLYGGVTEELLTRLFLMALFAWVLGLAWRAPGGGPAAGAFVVAIGAAALTFGAGHLPAVSAMTPLTAPLVARTLVLNTAAGCVFGWLYWRSGLEAAMVAHASAHLVLQPLAPLAWRADA